MFRQMARPFLFRPFLSQSTAFRHTPRSTRQKQRRPGERGAAQSPRLVLGSRLVLAGALLALLALAGCDAPRRTTSPSESHASSPAADGDLDEDHGHADHGLVELGAEAIERADIRTASAQRRRLAPRLLTTGQVDFDQDRLSHVAPRISGRVHRVHALLGEITRVGETLAEIDSIELGQAKAAYLQAKAKEELARTRFERARNLTAHEIISEQHLLENQAALRETQAELHTAEETLRLFGLAQAQIDALTYEDRAASIYPLRAPFAGTVIERHVTLGELVTPERNLFTLADLGEVWIWIDVYQRDLARVHLGDEARARVDAFPQDVFEGEVSYLSSRVDAETRTVRARVDVANPEGKLRPGMFVEVELVDPHLDPPHLDPDGTGGARAPVLVVPESALVRDGDETLVFVAAGDRHFERRDVRLGRRSGNFAEILHGLEAGEPVVVEGAFLIKSAASKDSLGGGHHH